LEENVEQKRDVDIRLDASAASDQNREDLRP
jgi:hypothetical protein